MSWYDGSSPCAGLRLGPAGDAVRVLAAGAAALLLLVLALAGAVVATAAAGVAGVAGVPGVAGGAACVQGHRSLPGWSRSSWLLGRGVRTSHRRCWPRSCDRSRAFKRTPSR